ncbi:MAG: OmpA family protein [Mariprofundus sp.]|nr:OmpA family protein [Mariprofundus sp.]
MHKFRFFLVVLLFSVSSCSTIDSIFNTGEPEVAVPVSNDKIASENNRLETEIYALRGSLQQIKDDIARKKAEKARALGAEQQATAQKAIPIDRLWVTVSFRSGHMALTSDSGKALKRLAAKFLSKDREQTIEVRGYTDDEPIGGYARSRHTPRHPYKTNLALSQVRADNVAGALINAGLPQNIVQAQGFGAADFAAGNNTDAGRQKNRRAEIHLVSR